MSAGRLSPAPQSSLPHRTRVTGPALPPHFPASSRIRGDRARRLGRPPASDRLSHAGSAFWPWISHAPEQVRESDDVLAKDRRDSAGIHPRDVTGRLRDFGGGRFEQNLAAETHGAAREISVIRAGL